MRIYQRPPHLHFSTGHGISTAHPVVQILLRTIDLQEVTCSVQLDPLTKQAQETALTGSCTLHKKHVVLSSTVAPDIQVRHVYQATSQNSRSRRRQFGIQHRTMLSFRRCTSERQQMNGGGGIVCYR
jgi:hypothetical protein